MACECKGGKTRLGLYVLVIIILLKSCGNEARLMKIQNQLNQIQNHESTNP